MGLADVPLLATLDRPRLTRLAGAAPPRTVEAGAVLAVRGEPATHLIVVEAGGVTATRATAAGRLLRLGEFPAPCAVDKSAVLDGGGHTATWLARARSRVRLVPATDFLDLLDDVPAARRHVLAHLARRPRDQQDDLVPASFADAVTRTAAWLVRAAGSGGRVILPGAQAGLAEAIGMTRVSVNRALRTLAAEGLVRVEPGARGRAPRAGTACPAGKPGCGRRAHRVTVSAVLIRRELPSDVGAIHAVHRAAFETAVEADLVTALRADAGWLPALSLVAVGPDGTVVGHVVCTRAHVATTPALGLGPLGVLPAWQRRGVGGALMHAVLGAADALGEPVVVLLGHKDYYPRFGFAPAAGHGITPPVPEWGDHFQARPLTAYDPSVRGEFAYAAPFRDL